MIHRRDLLKRLPKTEDQWELISPAVNPLSPVCPLVLQVVSTKLIPIFFPFPQLCLICCYGMDTLVGAMNFGVQYSVGAAYQPLQLSTPCKMYNQTTQRGPGLPCQWRQGSTVLHRAIYFSGLAFLGLRLLISVYTVSRYPFKWQIVICSHLAKGAGIIFISKVTDQGLE